MEKGVRRLAYPFRYLCLGFAEPLKRNVKCGTLFL